MKLGQRGHGQIAIVVIPRIPFPGFTPLDKSRDNVVDPLGQKKRGIIIFVHCAKLGVFDNVIILGRIAPIIGDVGIHILGIIVKTSFEYLTKILI
jgi:hypothetical protein